MSSVQIEQIWTFGFGLGYSGSMILNRSRNILNPKSSTWNYGTVSMQPSGFFFVPYGVEGTDFTRQSSVRKDMRLINPRLSTLYILLINQQPSTLDTY